MKTRSASILASSMAASVMLAATPVMAADYPGTTSANANHAQAGQKAFSDARSQKAADKAWEQAHRASKIIGTEVQNPKGEKVGTVKDLVMDDPASGQITRVVVSVGGVSGLGDKLFAIPYDAVRRDEGRNVLVLNSDSDLAHAFDDNHWQALANQGTNHANTAGTTSGSNTAASNAASTPSSNAASAAASGSANDTAGPSASSGNSAGNTSTSSSTPSAAASPSTQASEPPK
jgi:sporulation protein YlmC with PRC-barrel domain